MSRAWALLHAVDLYHPPDSGVVSGLIYGPVGYFAYIPAAALSEPAPAVAVGVALSAGMTLCAAWLLLSAARYHDDPPRSIALAVFLILAMHWYVSRAADGMWMIHVDATVLALCALCCFLTWRHDLAQSFSPQLALAALCAALAVWGKQTTVPVLFVPGLWLALQGARGAAILLATAGIGCAALLGLAFGALYGFEDMAFTMFAAPASHARHPGLILQDGARIWEFLDVGALALIAWFLAAGRTDRASLVVRPEALYLLLGLALIPTSVLGRIKAGGAVNNYGGPDFFLAAAVGASLLGAWNLAGTSRRRTMQVALAGLLLIQTVRVAPQAVETWFTRIQSPKKSPASEAFEYARANPGTTYFAWHPLASALAEGKLYHSYFGVHQRDQTAQTVSDEHLRAGLPEKLERIAFKGAIYHAAMARLPEFACRVEVAELPGWTVFERCPAEQTPP